jgi:hypothetical protein
MKADIGLDESSVLTVTGPDLRHGGHPGEGVAHLRERLAITAWRSDKSAVPLEQLPEVE